MINNERIRSKMYVEADPLIREFFNNLRRCLSIFLCHFYLLPLTLKINISRNHKVLGIFNTQLIKRYTIEDDYYFLLFQK